MVERIFDDTDAYAFFTGMELTEEQLWELGERQQRMREEAERKREAKKPQQPKKDSYSHMGADESQVVRTNTPKKILTS